MRITNIINKINLKKSIPVFIILIATIVASRQLFTGGYFPIHDDMQVARLYQMDLCFRDGQIPCRWVPDMGYGYGYPLFNYYPPLPFYFGELVHTIGFSIIDSTKVMFIAGFLMSAVLMYLFSRKLWGDWGGLLSSVLYLFAPYHSVDVYVRGAMNEHWALAFLPGVCWAVYEIIDGNDKKYISVMSLFFSFLLLSHNLMALIFTPVIGVFALLLIWLKKKKFYAKIWPLLIGGVWGVGLAAFFTLPVLLEKKFVHVETMLMGYFNYLAHYVSIGKLFFTRFWGYGSSSWLQTEGMPFQIGFPQWPLAVIAFILFIVLYFRRKISKEKAVIASFFFFLFLFSSFLIHSRSVFIWDRISFFAYLQFPWRFLTLVIFSVSVLGGGVIILLKDGKKQIAAAFLLIILTVVLNFSFFKPQKIIEITDSEKLFSAKGWNRLQTDAIFDYLPIYAKAPPGGPAPELPEIKLGFAEIFEVVKTSNRYGFKVRAEIESIIRVPVYDFPGWKAKVDNYKAEITHDNDLGLITLTVPEGEHFVNLEFTNSPIRLLGNFISLTSFGLLVTLFVKRVSQIFIFKKAKKPEIKKNTSKKKK